jgi:MFS family permease
VSRVKNTTAFLLLGANFLNVFGWALLTPLYALYATELGASPQSVTFTWSFYTLLAGVLMILLGWAEDRIRNKQRFLTFGYTVQSIGVIVLLLAENVQWLMVGLGIYAVGTGIIMPIWKVIFAKNERKGKEAAEWGFFHGVNTLLISAAAALSGLLYVAAGFQGILGLMAAIHILATLVSLGIKNTLRS